MLLRERGIYRLPNGRELVVLRNDVHSSSLFFSQSNEEGCSLGEVSVNETGRLVFDGRLTAWDISNLSDTGRTLFDLPDPLKDRVSKTEING